MQKAHIAECAPFISFQTNYEKIIFEIRKQKLEVMNHPKYYSVQIFKVLSSTNSLFLVRHDIIEQNETNGGGVFDDPGAKSAGSH